MNSSCNEKDNLRILSENVAIMLRRETKMAVIEACVTRATFKKITAAQLQLPREQQQNVDAVLNVIATLAKAKDNVWVYRKAFKKGAKFSTDHHLVVCFLRGLNHLKTRKRLGARRAYRIKWELLADKKVKHTFASKVAFLFRELAQLY